MSAPRNVRESNLYPIVEKWAAKHFGFFKTGINVGLSYSRVDVLGVRDIGGNLSGEVETIAIEVKRGTQPFATASGQALGYEVYANRVYLADVRETEFRPSEIEIASHLGIGLIRIHGSKCREVLSSPYHHPISRMSLELVERMGLGRCQMCGTTFEIGTKANRWLKVSRKSLPCALEKGKGFVFWNFELARRKRTVSDRPTNHGTSTFRRYICPDCVSSVFCPKE
jgi:hypothetical protein